MLVPIVNVVWVIIFACSEWPIHRELARRRTADGHGTSQDSATLVSEAARLERQGDWEAAARAYEKIAATPGDANAEYAANCAQRLRDKLGRLTA